MFFVTGNEAILIQHYFGRYQIPFFKDIWEKKDVCQVFPQAKQEKLDEKIVNRYRKTNAWQAKNEKSKENNKQK